MVRCLLAHSNQILFKDTSSLARNYEKLFVKYYGIISYESRITCHGYYVSALHNLCDAKPSLKKSQICVHSTGNLFEFLKFLMS